MGVGRGWGGVGAGRGGWWRPDGVGCGGGGWEAGGGLYYSIGLFGAPSYESKKC